MKLPILSEQPQLEGSDKLKTREQMKVFDLAKDVPIDMKTGNPQVTNNQSIQPSLQSCQEVKSVACHSRLRKRKTNGSCPICEPVRALPSNVLGSSGDPNVVGKPMLKVQKKLEETRTKRKGKADQFGPRQQKIQNKIIAFRERVRDGVLYCAGVYPKTKINIHFWVFINLLGFNC